MNALKQTQKKYIIRTLDLAGMIALFFIMIDQEPIAKGLIRQIKKKNIFDFHGLHYFKIPVIGHPAYRGVKV